MSAPPSTLASEYVAALRAYLAGGGEASLEKAYEFGRRFVEGGVHELTALHHQALASIAADSDEAIRARLPRAAEFFAEAVSPLEMALRSYRETAGALLALNARLESQNEELARAKEAAEAANKELEAFSYSVAHDLRAPLRYIDGFSQALVEDYEALLDEQGRTFLRHVRASAREMGQLITDLLQLSRVSRGELARGPVDVSALARGVVERLRRAHPDRDVAVDVEPGIEVFGDENLLAIALENLIGNAWKFTGRRADARITVGCVRDPEPVCFVRDNGAGFDPGFADKLFNAFQRLHTESEFEGTGVGLATVQRIIRRHGGRVWAQGAVGEGATFYWQLPGRAG